jgi:hypothetical protein
MQVVRASSAARLVLLAMQPQADGTVTALPVLNSNSASKLPLKLQR